MEVATRSKTARELRQALRDVAEELLGPRPGVDEIHMSTSFRMFATQVADDPGPRTIARPEDIAPRHSAAPIGEVRIVTSALCSGSSVAAHVAAAVAAGNHVTLTTTAPVDPLVSMLCDILRRWVPSPLLTVISEDAEPPAAAKIVILASDSMSVDGRGREPSVHLDHGSSGATDLLGLYSRTTT